MGSLFVQPYVCTVSEGSSFASEADASASDEASDEASAPLRMGLSLFFTLECKDPMSVSIVVSSPNGELSWECAVSERAFDGASYYGSSDFCMPLGCALPVGLWHVSIYYKDGSCVERAFDVGYSDVSGALERFASSGSSSAWFDSISNLTVL